MAYGCLAELERIARVEHDRDFVGHRLCRLLSRSKRLGMRSMREAVGMERHHAGLDVVAAEELAGVVGALGEVGSAIGLVLEKRQPKSQGERDQHANIDQRGRMQMSIEL